MKWFRLSEWVFTHTGDIHVKFRVTGDMSFHSNESVAMNKTRLHFCGLQNVQMSSVSTNCVWMSLIMNVLEYVLCVCVHVHTSAGQVN